MVDWMQFINALGTTEVSKKFYDLNLAIEENAQLYEDPSEYNDPIGHTKYYKYPHSGLEIGFRKDVLNHIHFYFNENEGYSIFKGNLMFGINSEWSEIEIIQALGEPSTNGGGKIDILLGYINRWIKYENEKYALHLQFDQNNFLYQATLMMQVSNNY
ncbi:MULTISPECIES: hypothetical protein [Photorhabdus]|uniref:Uncharacterized protein n=2 Tax=Photorhabdus asymbiotica TaxID=291112 RepID=B6VN48_PHOAA|nr:hypothetical protein [Photorhabdus asymbiotica]RKS56541.1 hypothetical protein BDD30_3143 [Photorhabdus asymbiotica]CAQ85084.1 conserved hypothetical protein [Photorhabdus asymbiotica]CAR67578.1 Hypothetical Protein PA-RVA15-17-1009 [Photorhabdus asymbiotica subsp. asymbiotica ATCC 43949]